MGSLTEVGCVNFPTSEIVNVFDAGDYTYYVLSGKIRVVVPKKEINNDEFEMIEGVKYSDIIDADISGNATKIFLENGEIRGVEKISQHELKVLLEKKCGIAEMLLELGPGYFITNRAKYIISKIKKWDTPRASEVYFSFEYDGKKVLAKSGPKLDWGKMKDIMYERNKKC